MSWFLGEGGSLLFSRPETDACVPAFSSPDVFLFIDWLDSGVTATAKGQRRYRYRRFDFEGTDTGCRRIPPERVVMRVPAMQEGVSSCAGVEGARLLRGRNAGR